MGNALRVLRGYQKIGVSSRKNWNVDRDARRVRFVQPDTKISLPAEQEEDEDPDVHQSDPALVRPYESMLTTFLAESDDSIHLWSDCDARFVALSHMYCTKRVVPRDIQVQICVEGPV